MQKVAVSKEVDEHFRVPADSPLHTITSMRRMADELVERSERSGAFRSEQGLRNLLCWRAASTR